MSFRDGIFNGSVRRSFGPSSYGSHLAAFREGSLGGCGACGLGQSIAEHRRRLAPVTALQIAHASPMHGLGVTAIEAQAYRDGVMSRATPVARFGAHQKSFHGGVLGDAATDPVATTSAVVSTLPTVALAAGGGFASGLLVGGLIGVTLGFVFGRKR